MLIASAARSWRDGGRGEREGGRAGGGGMRYGGTGFYAARQVGWVDALLSGYAQIEFAALVMERLTVVE